jgi:hypothetical protein
VSTAVRGLRFVEVLTTAKRRVVAQVRDGATRDWKRVRVPMYTAGTYGHSLHLLVLEGTPPRGWVVALVCDEAVQWADAFDATGRRLGARIHALDVVDIPEGTG